MVEVGLCGVGESAISRAAGACSVSPGTCSVSPGACNVSPACLGPACISPGCASPYDKNKDAVKVDLMALVFSEAYRGPAQGIGVELDPEKRLMEIEEER